MTKIRNIFLMTAFLLALGGLQAATAATVTTSLGNTTPGFNDGNTPTIIQLIAAQGLQPAPFEAGKGNELFANLSETWTFNYAAIADTILSASLTLGIADHDSAASGNQVALYELDGNNLTAALNSEFEATGGADGEYNIYSINLGPGIFADLTDGLAIIGLDLTGPGLQTALFGGAVSETAANGAHLIFSTLTIETGDISVIPIPAAAPLFASAIALMGLYRRRVLRNAA